MPRPRRDRREAGDERVRIDEADAVIYDASPEAAGTIDQGPPLGRVERRDDVIIGVAA